MAKFCSSCGAALGEGARFCTSCGQPVAAASAAPVAAAPASVPPPVNVQPAAAPRAGGSFLRTALAWIVTFVVAYFLWTIAYQIFGEF